MRSARAWDRLAVALGQVFLPERARDGVPPHLVLEFIGTDNPTPGAQEHSADQGYYDQHMDHPLLVCDGPTGQMITAVRRPGTKHASHGVLASPALYAWCAPGTSAARSGWRPMRGWRGRWPTSRPHERREVLKAEVLAKGTNTRFVVTTRSAKPPTVCDG